MITTKLNESFYKIEGTPEQLQPIIRKLTLQDPNAFFDPMIKRGLKSADIPFYVIQDKALIVPSGLVQFLGSFGVQYQYSPIFTKEEILDFITEFNSTLPFDMHDFQEKAILDSLYNMQQLCLAATSAGKSVIISGICEFLRRKGMRGLILVPSISLTTQLRGDILDYGLQELYDNTHLIGGDNKEKSLEHLLTISTWQSCMLMENGETKTMLLESDNLTIENWDVDSNKKKNGKYKKITYSDGTTEIVPF